MKDLKPKVKSSQIVYKGYFDLRQDILEKHDGQTLAYTSLIIPTHAAAILAQDKSGRWILNREYRYPTGESLLGCPGGRLERGEDPIEGGRRELFEETGYWADEMILMGCNYPFPGVTDQKIYYLLAKNARLKGEQKLDPFEFIETELKTDTELREEIRRTHTVDGILCTALWYKNHYMS